MSKTDVYVTQQMEGFNQEERDKLKRKNVEANAEIERLNAHVASLEREKESTLLGLSILEKENLDLKRRNVEANAEIERLNAHVASLEKEKKSILLRLNNLEKENLDLKERNDKANAKIEKLKQKIKDLKAHVMFIEEEDESLVRDLEKENLDSKKQIDKANAEIEELKERLQRTQEELANRLRVINEIENREKQMRDGMSSEIERYKQQLQNIQEELELAKKRLREACYENFDLTQKNKVLQRKLEIEERENKAKTAENDRQMQNMKEEIEDLQCRLKEAQNENDKIKRNAWIEKQRSDEEIQSLCAKIKEIEEGKKSLQDELMFIQLLLSETKGKLQLTIQERFALRDKYGKKVNEQEQLIEELNNQIKEFKRQKADVESALIQLSAKHGSTLKELAHYKNEETYSRRKNDFTTLGMHGTQKFPNKSSGNEKK